MIALIAAYTKNRVIGHQGKIPWVLANEKKRFRALTSGNVVVMGRKTYQEIGKPLPDRINIIVSSTEKLFGDDLYTVSSLKEALEICETKFPDKIVFISGGERLYRESISLADKFYLTEIDAIIDGDAFFPEFNENDYDKKLVETYHEELDYVYFEYTRKKTLEK